MTDEVKGNTSMGFVEVFNLSTVDFTGGSEAVDENESRSISVARIGVVDFGGIEIEVRHFAEWIENIRRILLPLC
jgi:hypothetical protein